jgi:hypothetical protein
MIISGRWVQCSLLHRGFLDGVCAQPAAAAPARPPIRIRRATTFGGPRSYAARHMHNALLEVRPLAPDTTMKRAFVETMLEWIDAGWSLWGFSSLSGTFLCKRAQERSLIFTAPKSPGNSHPAQGRLQPIDGSNRGLAEAAGPALIADASRYRRS